MTKTERLEAIERQLKEETHTDQVLRDEGKAELLRYLIGIADNTKGAKVWRALFVEQLIRCEHREHRMFVK